MSQNPILLWSVRIAICLSLIVVMLGAYTRLTNAGLGCPDWPGCYGRMVVPNTQEHLLKAQAQYPKIPIESRKAWTEMIHRYAAGSLALLIFFIGFFILIQRARYKNTPWHLPVLLILLVIFQAMLGMWTVTLKLLPAVVMGHLLGGMLIFAFLCRFYFQINNSNTQNLPQFKSWLRLGLVIVFFQIALGGWVSSNYAGIACIGFPKCNGVWIPDLYLAKGFHLFSTPGLNYQGGLLDTEIRITIQYIHRLGALLTACYLLSLSLIIGFKVPKSNLKNAAIILAGLVVIQWILGLINVLYLLPIESAVAHNGVAALLLATVFSMLHFANKHDTIVNQKQKRNSYAL